MHFLRRVLAIVIGTLLSLAVCFELFLVWMCHCPSVSGEPTLTPDDAALLEALRNHVSVLANSYPNRNVGHPGELFGAASYIANTWSRQGLHVVTSAAPYMGVNSYNIEVDFHAGKGSPVLIVGAHYDSPGDSPGADDNGSGVASLLELSRLLLRDSLTAEVRLVAFVNEEFAFGKHHMGSGVYAQQFKQEGRQLKAMIALDCVGYFSDKDGSQRYPSLLKHFFPSVGNFIGVVGNLYSHNMVQSVAKALKQHSGLPVECISAPEAVPGVGWSDHASFWNEGFQAVMISDTATYRNPHYHKPSDTVSTVDFVRLSQFVPMLHGAVLDLQ